MRKKLQAGWRRNQISALAFLLIGGLVVFYWDRIIVLASSNLASPVNPLDGIQKIAFVAAAFAVTTYNLRTRVIDFILKIDSTPTHVRNLANIAKDCGRRLTNLVILHTTVALFMATGGFIRGGHWLASWYAGLTIGLFTVSIIQFIYILFAFERLELYMLEDAQEKAIEKERKDLLKDKDK